jgi:hypothetical protein
MTVQTALALVNRAVRNRTRVLMEWRYRLQTHPLIPIPRSRPSFASRFAPPATVGGVLDG